MIKRKFLKGSNHYLSNLSQHFLKGGSEIINHESPFLFPLKLHRDQAAAL